MRETPNDINNNTTVNVLSRNSYHDMLGNININKHECFVMSNDEILKQIESKRFSYQTYNISHLAYSLIPCSQF